MTRALGVLVISLVLQATSSLAPRLVLSQLEAGSRIRITSDRGSRVGTLVSVENDSLRYTTSDTAAVTALPLASVVKLERSVGKRSNAGRGATIGGLVGGGLGLGLGLIASLDDDQFYEVGPEDVAVVTLFLGAIGAGVGALIGSASHRDSWETVPLPAKF
jgi:hypothetical protein